MEIQEKKGDTQLGYASIAVNGKRYLIKSFYLMDAEELEAWRRMIETVSWQIGEIQLEQAN